MISMEVWHTIQVLQRQGRSMRSMARELGISRNTIKRYWDNQIPPRYVRRSIDWLIKRLIKVGARISYHARRWYVHVASAFPLAHHYRAVLACGT